MNIFKEKHTLISTCDYFGEERLVFDVSVRRIKYFFGIPYYISKNMGGESSFYRYAEYLNRKYNSNVTFDDKKDIISEYIRDFKLKCLLDDNPNNEYFMVDRNITTMIKETPTKIH